MDARVVTRHRVAPTAAVVAAGALAAVMVLDPRLSHPSHIALVLVACAGYVVMMEAQRRWGGLSLRRVVTAVTAVCVAAVAVPPRATTDLWWYATYGRIVATFHASPYTHVPASFPDVFLAMSGKRWMHTPSVYGPLFTFASAVVAAATGSAAVPTRLFYQLLATGALAAVCVVIWRRTRAAAAIAFVALNPVVALYLLNGGRNDILVGLAVLAAVVLSQQRRDAAAGVSCALGALVKLTGLVGLVAIAATTFHSRGRVAAARTLVSGLAVVAFGYAFVGTDALLAPMRTAGALFSSGSVWRLLPLFGTHAPSTDVTIVALGALTVLVLVLYLRALPAVVTASFSALLLGAAYTLPGYSGWVLPTAALEHDSTVSRLASAQAVLLVVGYEIVRHPVAGVFGDALGAAARVAMVAGTLVILVLLLRNGLRRDGSRRPLGSTAPDAARARDVAVPIAGAIASLRPLIVVPTYNERATIEPLLRGLRSAVPAADVLVVDDGSPDGTAARAHELARELGHVEVLRRPALLGLGTAYCTGFRRGLEGRYDVLVEIDADLSHDPYALPSLLQPIAAGADVVIGSRYVPGGQTPNWSVGRRWLSRAGGRYARTMLRLPVHDVTSGFRAYRADVLRRVDLATVEASGYGFQIEMIDRCARAGARVVEVPIVFAVREAGESKMSASIVLEALWLVTRWGVQMWTGRRPRSAIAARVGEASSVVTQPVFVHPSGRS